MDGHQSIQLLIKRLFSAACRQRKQPETDHGFPLHIEQIPDFGSRARRGRPGVPGVGETIESWKTDLREAMSVVKSRAIGLAGFLLLTQPLVSSANDLPEGVLQAGSLANQKLMNDAMAGVVGKLAAKGCEAPESFLPYVLRMPEGPVGERAWVERWVVTGCEREFPIDVEFREDGAQGADWLVR